VSHGGRPEVLEVGRIAKPHGLGGEVVVDLVTNLSGRLETGSSLSTAEGCELVVEAANPFGNRWIVKFSGIDDRGRAEEMRGCRLVAAPVEEPGALWVDELIGASVRDPAGHLLGKVSAVVANPASDLLELEEGGLVPLVFVVDFSSRTEEAGEATVVVDVPEGLLE
jgi:16S rRNA processing protein RimM